MTDQSSPIRPPCELAQQWITRWVDTCQQDCDFRTYLATQSAQWGWDQRGTINEAQLQERADQELEACLAHLFRRGFSDADILGLRAARRPKPPSLKEQGLAAAARFYAKGHEDCTEQEVRDDYDALCCALEALPND